MFWLALPGTAALALCLRDQTDGRAALQKLTAALIALRLDGYAIRFGWDAVARRRSSTSTPPSHGPARIMT